MSESPNDASRYYPELARFPSAEAAREARSKWYQMMYRRPGFWLALIGYAVLAALVLASIFIALRRWVQFSSTVISVVVASFVSASSMIAVTGIYRHRFRRFLRRELLALGVPICLECGYDLTCNTSHRCPECGKRRWATVVRTRERP